MSEADLVKLYRELEVVLKVLKIGVPIILTASICLTKIWIRKVIEKEIKKVICRLLESISKPECVHGKMVLDAAKLVNDQYEFGVLDNVKFRPDLWNRIILQPIKGNKKLEYNCKVDEGRLKVKFKNFRYDEDLGVVWTIIYYPEMVKYMDS